MSCPTKPYTNKWVRSTKFGVALAALGSAVRMRLSLVEFEGLAFVDGSLAVLREDHVASRRGVGQRDHGVATAWSHGRFLIRKGSGTARAAYTTGRPFAARRHSSTSGSTLLRPLMRDSTFFRVRSNGMPFVVRS